MEYQIRKRKERFSVVLEVWSEGKRKVISGGTHGTERAAHRAGERLLARYETSPARRAAAAGEQPLSAWIADWLEDIAQRTKPSTHATYRWRAEKYIIPTLGATRLKDLDQLTIRRWLKLPATKKCALPVLRNCLAEACALALIPSNPATGISTKQSRSLQAEQKETHNIKVWSYEDSRTLLTASQGHKAEALVILGLYCGLRPGEVRALEWSDIDFVNGTLKISRSITRAGSKEFCGSTKAGRSRTVPLPFDAAVRLLRLQEVNAVSAPTSEPKISTMEITDTVISSGLVLTGAKHSHYLDRWLRDLTATAQVPYLNPHCLRHTCLSMMLNQGVPASVVAKIAGHSSPYTTLSIYSHCMPEDLELSRGVLERALGTAHTSPPKEAPDLQLQ